MYFNLSGVYDGKNPRLDLSDVPGTNCYCDEAAEKQLLQRIGKASPLPLIRFIDSGNYHYLSLFFMGQIEEPFTLLLLDHHPDTQPPVFGDILSCGSWVKRAAETLPALRSVIMAGVDPSLIEEASPLPEKVKAVSISELPSLLEDLSTPLYISLDKDAMSEDFARTDWSQGEVSLDEILSVLGLAFSHNEVLGLDVCGEKKENPTDEDIRINEATNERILEAVCGG